MQGSQGDKGQGSRREVGMKVEVTRGGGGGRERCGGGGGYRFNGGGIDRASYPEVSTGVTWCWQWWCLL